MFLDGAGAAQAAKRRAHHDALNRAEAMLAIVPCPTCKQRNRWGTRLFVAWSALAAVALVIIGLCGGAFFRQSLLGVVVGGVGGVVFAILHLRRRMELWRNAATDVNWLA